MNRRLLLLWWKARRLARAGFTVAELLIGAAIGAFLLTGMLYLVVEMMRVERTQTARGETEREMAQALDYITNELREAVLVYDRNCLGATGTGNGPTCPGLNLPVNTVLAFWKREDVPDLNFLNIFLGGRDWTEENIQRAIDNYLQRQDCANNRDCTTVFNYTRTQYTLVVYALCPNEGRPGPRCETPGFGIRTQPRGPARIMRGYFRQYQWVDNFKNRLEKRDPLAMPNWAGSDIAWFYNTPNADADPLVENVDWEPQRVNVNCPAGYISTTGAGADTGFRPFYACVRERSGAAETGFVQDVFVYLRGNAAERAGLPELEGTGTNIYRPAVETQVRTRGSYNRKPS